jgi:hypothetical protein
MQGFIKLDLYAQCHYDECPYSECYCAECHYAEWHNAECSGDLLMSYCTEQI